MNQSKSKISGNLQAAKSWIDKADRSFASQAQIKGELNLFLAQAELKHVTEMTSQKPFWQRSILRHAAAAALAVMFVAGGIYCLQPRPTAVAPSVTASGALTSSQPLSAPVALAATFTPTAIEPAPAVRQQPVQAAIPPPAVAPAPTVYPTVQATVPSVEKTAPPPVVTMSDKEMNQLVRAAGKTLRGQ